MSHAILVGYDPRTRDRAPVRFGVAAARFTGAPLIVACICGSGLGLLDEALAAGADEALEELEAELLEEGVSAQFRELQGLSAPRSLHEAAEADGAEETLRELGERLGVSAERVRQIEERALSRLRDAAAADSPCAMYAGHTAA